MKRLIIIASCIFLSQISTAQVMMLFSSDSLTNITSPLDVDSLFYWFAADVGVTDSLGGAIATDEGVGTWNDLSGNGYHVTQGTDGARPVYKATGGPGSKTCIQFDGTDDALISSNHWWGADDFTIIIVGKFANATRNATEVLIAKSEPTGDYRQWTIYGIGSPNYRGQADTYTSGTVSPVATGNTAANWKHSNFAIDVFHSSSSTLSVWSDGASVTMNDNTISGVYNTGNAPLRIGRGAGGAYLQGSISEIIVYSRALTATERAAIELYLNRKYDLY